MNSSIMKKVHNNRRMDDDDDNKNDSVTITKIVLDFDDALFPSHQYRQHGMLQYHQTASKQSVEYGRNIFKNEKEPNLMALKQKIDLVIFKLMQLYNKDCCVILSTANYDWVHSTLKHFGYLLSAYNTPIYSTQQWVKEHPKDFDNSNSLQAKQFLIKMLLAKWKKEEMEKYKNSGKVIRFRLISIGDSFFEFLASYKCGFDYVSRIKLLEEPSVDQMISLWDKMLFLCEPNILEQSVVFLTDNECCYLDENRMNELNQQCLHRIHNKNKMVHASSTPIIAGNYYLA